MSQRSGSAPFDKAAAGWLFFCTKEDGRGKNALEALKHAAVIATVLGKPEELQHLGGASEMYGAALLPAREGGNPDRDETVLAKGQAEIGMPFDVKEEISVAAFVNEVIPGQGAQRNAAEDNRSHVKGDFLSLPLALFADELDSFELVQRRLVMPMVGRMD